ncbi:hypothetical protein PNP03_13285, partial [Halobacterium salinarum]
MDQVEVVRGEIVLGILEEAFREGLDRVVDVVLEVLTQLLGEDIRFPVDVVEEAVPASVFEERAVTEEEIEVLEILKIALLQDCREINLVVGVEAVARRAVVEPPFLPVSEDGPLRVVDFLEVDVDLVARVFEVAFVLATSAGVERPAPAFGVRD